MQNYLVLIGIVIIVVGFVLKLDVISVVLISGVATGLAGGKGIVEILDIIGKGFIENRYMSLFFTTLVVIGIMEMLIEYHLTCKGCVENTRIDC